MSTLTENSTSSANYAQYGPQMKTTLPGPNARRIVADDERLIAAIRWWRSLAVAFA